MPSEKKHKSISFSRIILSLVLLFNINIGIVDLLPDAIAFFILANEFKHASLRAPFFAEARDAFKKLGIIALLKYPAAIIAASSGAGGAGNDMAALFSLTFSAFEIVYAIKAVRYIFDALYRLGERTSATALIKPFRVFGSSYMSCETLRFFTYLLTAAKCIFQAIPDMFRLTRIADDGFTVLTVSPGYSISVLTTQFFGLIIGVFWLIISVKFVTAVKTQGEYDGAVDSLVLPDDEIRLKKKERLDSLLSLLSLTVIASVFTLEIRFLNSDNINLIPHTVYGLLLVAVAIKLFKLSDTSTRHLTLISAACYTVSTVFYYVFETRFLYYFGYESLANTDATPPEYIVVEALGVIEALLLILTLIGVGMQMRQIILKHTGTALGSAEYSHSDRKYHRILLITNIAHVIMGCLFALFRCANVFSQAAYTTNVVERNEITEGVDVPDITYIPAIEWISTACAIICIAYIALTVYYASNVKDEIKMKYSAIGDEEL